MYKSLIRVSSKALILATSFSLAGTALAQSMTTIYVDTNGSCMAWNFLDASPGGSKYACTGLAPNTSNGRGSCKVEVPVPASYQFWVGVQNYNLNIDANGGISYKGNKPDVDGLRFSQNKIQFDTQMIQFENNGFPGSFSVEFDHPVTDICAESPDPGVRKKRLMILKGANFVVNGEWSGQVESSPTHFQNKGNDLVARTHPDYPVLPFIASHSPMTVSPNLYYWMDRRKHNAKPVLVVQGASCPLGYTTWDQAKGRFLLGAGMDKLDKNGESINAPLGERLGEVNVTLTESQMPNHHHAVNKVQHSVGNPTKGYGIRTHASSSSQAAMKIKPLVPRGGNRNGKTQSHNNIPPYVAVNFCVSK